MGNRAEITARLIEKTTGSKEKAEEYKEKMRQTIERISKLAEKEIDPVYRELAGKIDEAEKDSKYLPLILERLMTLEQAKLVNALPDPYLEPSGEKAELSPAGMAVTEQFAKDVGLDKETVDKYLVDGYEKGLLFPTRRGWQLSRSMGQFHDSSTNYPKVHEPLGQEYFDLWTVYDEEEWAITAPDRYKKMKTPPSRVLPRWKAIKDIPGVMPYEDVREILKATQANISLTNCPCRKTFGNRTCDIPVESCINFDRTAIYNINRGSGKRVNYEEALEALDKLDKYPVFHNVRNQKEIYRGILCNCHYDCCVVFQGLYSQPDFDIKKRVAKSRFEAVVDPEKCKKCKACLRMCNFEAAGMKYYPEFGEERAYIDTEKCMGCGCCVINCPSGARTMRMWQTDPDYIPDQFIEEYD